MTSDEKPPIYTTQEEYDQEVNDLKQLNASLFRLRNTREQAKKDLLLAEAEYIQAKKTYNDNWRRLRQVTRNIRRWHARIMFLREIRIQHESDTALLEQELIKSFKKPTPFPRRRWKRLSTKQKRYYLRIRRKEYRQRQEALRQFRNSRNIELHRLKTQITLARSREIYWTGEQTAIIDAINAQRAGVHYLRDSVLGLTAIIRETTHQIASVQAAIVKLEDEISRKVITPLPLIAVVDSETGYMLAFFKEPIHGKHAWVYDEAEKKTIAPLEQIRVEYTMTIETEGHEDIVAELTCWTFIDAESDEAEDLRSIQDITEKLMSKAEEWFHSKFVSKSGKGGIPDSAMRPDFTIQEREMNARVENEGFIQEWYQTLEGKWVKRPRIIKRGVGYYSTSEPATWHNCYIFCEFGHDEELVGTHKQPRDGYEIIDP